MRIKHSLAFAILLFITASYLYADQPCRREPDTDEICITTCYPSRDKGKTDRDGRTAPDGISAQNSASTCVESDNEEAAEEIAAKMYEGDTASNRNYRVVKVLQQKTRREPACMHGYYGWCSFEETSKENVYVYYYSFFDDSSSGLLETSDPKFTKDVKAAMAECKKMQGHWLWL